MVSGKNIVGIDYNRWFALLGVFGDPGYIMITLTSFLFFVLIFYGQVCPVCSAEVTSESSTSETKS